MPRFDNTNEFAITFSFSGVLLIIGVQRATPGKGCSDGPGGARKSIDLTSSCRRGTRDHSNSELLSALSIIHSGTCRLWKSEAAFCSFPKKDDRRPVTAPLANFINISSLLV